MMKGCTVKTFPLLVMAVLVCVASVVVSVAVAQDAGGPGVDMQAAAENIGQNLSNTFWGGIDHVVNVLVDFIGRIFMKLADAVLAVLHGVGIGTSR